MNAAHIFAKQSNEKLTFFQDIGYFLGNQRVMHQLAMLSSRISVGILTLAGYFFVTWFCNFHFTLVRLSTGDTGVSVQSVRLAIPMVAQEMLFANIYDLFHFISKKK